MNATSSIYAIEYKTAHTCSTETFHTGRDKVLAAFTAIKVQPILENRRAKHAVTS